jgi:hypothetical protein
MNEREDVPQVEQPKPDESWKQRLVVEFDELQVKLSKLSTFIDKIEADEVDVDPLTRALLVAQHGAMTSYLGILSIRINARVQVS